MERPETNESPYRPVDPYRVSATKGAKNVLGRSRPGPTMDEVKIPKRIDLYYPSYYPRYGAGRTAAPARPDLSQEEAASETTLSSTKSTLLSKSEKEQPEPEAKQDFPEPETSFSLLALFLGAALDQLPRQLYLYLHLRMPALYWSRVSRVFQDANMSMSEIKHMALEIAQNGESDKLLMEQGLLPYASSRSAPWTRLRSSWDHFITSLVAEWSTLNIISALLLSAILTILQIESAMAWPLARFSALLSLLCALMSLLYGCIYIIRFSTMKRTTKAAEWAFESQSSRTAIFWNVWIMLSLPAVWLGWAMIFFVICVMTMVWQTGTTADAVTPELSFGAALAPRTVVSGVLALGLLYLSLITSTMRRYGDAMDEAWKTRVKSWAEEIKAEEGKDSVVIIMPTTPPRLRPPFRGDDKYTPQWYTNGAADHTGYPAMHHGSGGWPPPQVHLVGEPRPSVPFVDAPAPGVGRESTVSWDLYQDRYRLARSPSPLLYGEDGEARQDRRLPLPPSDDRVFKRQEYIGEKVLKWLSDVEKNKENGEQSPIPFGPEDEPSVSEMPPVEMWLSQLQRTGATSEDPNLVQPSSEDHDGGEGAMLTLRISGNKTEPGEERVASWLDGVNMERPSIPPVPNSHHREGLSYRQSESEPHANTGSTEETVESTSTPLAGRTQANPEVPRCDHPAAPQSPLLTHEDGHLPLDSAPTPSTHPDQDESPATQLEIRPDGPTLQLAPMNGLRSTDNMQLGTHRVLPHPDLGAQGFSREGTLVKILALQNRGAEGDFRAAAHASIPGDISPQIWHTFTLDILSAWSNLGYGGDRVSVNCESNQLWWSPQEQHALLNFVALVDMWSSAVFSASRRRLIVVGEEHVSGALPNLRDIAFAVYIAPLDMDPLVVEQRDEAGAASFIRFYCDAMWGPSARTSMEPDIYVRGHQSAPAGNNPPESVDIRGPSVLGNTHL